MREPHVVAAIDRNARDRAENPVIRQRLRPERIDVVSRRRRCGLSGHEHGGHCELEFDGLEVADEDVLLGVGDGMKITQIRLGPARLTHCMRWLGLSKRCMEIASEYVGRREGFGIKLADRESVQIKLGQVAHQIQIGRLLTMHAAWKLDQGDRARKEVSMAKVHVADTLHNAADVAIQLNGARGFSKDTILEWIYRAARSGLAESEMEVIADVLRRVQAASNVTIVVIAHHMGFIRSLASRAVVLDFGRVIAEGPPADVLRDPNVMSVFVGSAHV